MKKELNAQAISDAIMKWPSRYRLEDGSIVLGETVSATPKALINDGWKNVSRLDKSDFKALGLRIAKGTYAGGVRSGGRVVDVVCVKD